jgi:toxin ParE1/3/4
MPQNTPKEKTLMRRIIFAPRAYGDLAEIYDYTREHWGDTQAGAYIHQLNEVFLLLAQQPLIGQAHKLLSKNSRLYPAAEHICIYRVGQSEIEIQAVLHHTMDTATQIRKKRN